MWRPSVSISARACCWSLTSLWQHPPLWRGGCNAGALREISPAAGLQPDEIAELLRLEDGTHCEEASSLAEHKLKDVREKMADLARMEAVLSELVRACHARRGTFPAR